MKYGNKDSGHYNLITKRDRKWYYIDGIDVEERQLEKTYKNVYLLIYIKIGGNN